MQVNPWDLALTPLQIDPATGQPRVQVQAPPANIAQQIFMRNLSQNVPLLGGLLGAADSSLQPRETTTGLENLFLDPFRSAGAWAKSAQADLGKTAYHMTTSENQRNASAAAKPVTPSGASGSPFSTGAAPTGKPAGPGGMPTGLDAGWERIKQIEGGLNPDGTFRVNRSSGAVGPSQMLPSTGPEAARMAGLPWNEKRFRTDRAYNEALGKAYFTNLTQRYGGDMAKAALAYHSGMGNVDKGNIGPAGRDYVAKFTGGVGGGGAGGAGPGFMNPFDPTYFNAAAGELEAGRQAALTPFSFTQDVGESPAIPDPILAPKTDWTAADASLQKLRPQEMAEKEKQAITREGMWRGLGEALMRMPDGAGLGQVLAMAGGGMLAGKMEGAAEVRQRMDKFDEKMARFNVAVAERDVLKASTARQEAQQEAATLNAYAQQKWKVAYDKWASEASPSIQGNNIISTKTVDGKKTTVVTPIAPMVNSMFALQRAQLMTQMAGASQQGAAMVAQANNSLLMATTASSMATANDPNAAIVAGPMAQAVAAVASGYGPDIIGATEWESLSKEAGRRAVQSGVTPGSEEYTMAVQQFIATELTRAAMMGNKTVQEALGSYGSVAQATQEARDRMNAKRQVRQGPKGATTTTTYGGE